MGAVCFGVASFRKRAELRERIKAKRDAAPSLIDRHLMKSSAAKAEAGALAAVARSIYSAGASADDLFDEEEKILLGITGSS
jgi:hypothetical protein